MNECALTRSKKPSYMEYYIISFLEFLYTYISNIIFIRSCSSLKKKNNNNKTMKMLDY